jgi:hypothetical protein
VTATRRWPLLAGAVLVAPVLAAGTTSALAIAADDDRVDRPAMVHQHDGDDDRGMPMKATGRGAPGR